MLTGCNTVSMIILVKGKQLLKIIGVLVVPFFLLHSAYSNLQMKSTVKLGSPSSDLLLTLCYVFDMKSAMMNLASKKSHPIPHLSKDGAIKLKQLS